MQTTFIDYFSGIGGFRAGLEACGMKCIGHCEINKYADKSYRAIFDVKEDEWFASDITKIQPGDVPCAHLWTAGFPCQDISIAGSQRGLAGERSSLFFEIVRLIEGKVAEDRPQWVILENVKNLFSVHGGWDFATVLFEMASLGYDLQYGLVNSRDFGVPQNRERVYIVAHRHTGDGCTGRIFPLPSGNGKALIQIIGGMQGRRVYCPEGISATLTAQGGGGGAKTGLYCMCVGVNRIDGIKERLEFAHTITAGDYRGLDRNQTQNAVLEGCEACMQLEDKNGCPFSFIDLNKNPKLTDIARCIKAHYNAGVTNRGTDNSGVLHLCARAVLTPDRAEKRQNGPRIKACGQPSFTLTAQDRHGVLLMNCKAADCCPKLKIREGTKQGYAEADYGDSISLAFSGNETRRGRGGKGLAQTLDTSCNQGIVLACGWIRRLTPRECWRLQGFSDGMFDRAKVVNSDSQLYKQAGNSVTVTVVYTIGMRILEVQNKMGG